MKIPVDSPNNMARPYIYANKLFLEMFIENTHKEKFS